MTSTSSSPGQHRMARRTRVSTAAMPWAPCSLTIAAVYKDCFEICSTTYTPVG